MTLTVNDILKDNSEEFFRILAESISNDIRVALPGVIQSFDATTQTVTVQPSIREHIMTNPAKLRYSWVDLPLIPDVPIVVPRAGGFALTLPVQAGDECLLVFADMSIDSWFQNGGTKNTQVTKQRHDLSDAFAILGCWSQPRTLPNYATNAAQLRSDDGTTYVSVTDGEIDLVATTVKVNGTVIS